MISPDQHPIGSGFGPASTAMEVVEGIDLTGQTAIVTGGYSGIGVETVRALVSAGAQVIVPARDRDKANRNLAGIEGVEIKAMDLTDPVSIAAFAGRVIASGRAISILINSAGIMAAPLMRDADGHESQFATNHLGHFRLVAGLWPALKAAGRARVVCVSSRGVHIAGVDFDDIDFRKRPYDKWLAYGQAKTANALFAIGLDRCGRKEGIRAFSLHPGQIITDLARHLSQQEIDAFEMWEADGSLRNDPANGIKNVQQGAATSVWCATSPALEGLGGVYCEDCDIAVVGDDPATRKGVAPWAADRELAERLWLLSEQMTGLRLA